ncbi:MAG: DUF5916 domain-containing protein, partial [Woeseiaceae bacterium]
TSGEVTIDGVMDEAAWDDAVAIAMDIETRPGENTPARVETTAYLVENGESVFVAFDARDPDPSRIRAYLRDRDSAFNDDFVGIVLDTYGDERRAFEFFANALGVQMDLTYDDINENEDDSWDSIWNSKGVISDKGYIVEMEIPLSQLRFQKLAGNQTWGIDLLRFYPRDFRYRLSNNPQDRDVNCYLCQLTKIEGLEGVEPSRDLELVPTITASQVDTTDSPGIVPLQSGDADAEAGLNVRWGITPDLTANLAINPDFSQVEADAAQLDVNEQFALFFPEKRPFFLEGADYFTTPIRAVFTRTVADPDVGAKLTGKRNDNTFGIFANEDAITNLIFPGSQRSRGTSLEQSNTAFVGRYSRSFGESSSVGALLTTRSGDAYHNHVGGLDLRWKITDNHNVRAQYLRSDTEYPDPVATDFSQPAGSFDGDAVFLGYDYDSRNWFAYVRHRDRGEGFRADSGFVPQVDIEQQIVGIGRQWHGDEDNWWSKIRLNGDWDITHDQTGRLLEREIEAYFAVDGPMQSSMELGYLTRDTEWNGQLFEERKQSFYGEFQPTGGLLVGIWSRWGTQVDFANTRLGDQTRFEPFVNWNVNRNLLLKFNSAFVKLDTRQGANIFDARVYDVRLTWQFSLRSFVRLTTQLQDIKRNPAEFIAPVDARRKDLGRQLLYSYKLNPQTVFFLGYSDALIDNDNLTGLETTDRTWFMKIGYAWTP